MRLPASNPVQAFCGPITPHSHTRAGLDVSTFYKEPGTQPFAVPGFPRLRVSAGLALLHISSSSGEPLHDVVGPPQTPKLCDRGAERATLPNLPWSSYRLLLTNRRATTYSYPRIASYSVRYSWPRSTYTRESRCETLRNQLHPPCRSNIISAALAGKTRTERTYGSNNSPQRGGPSVVRISREPGNSTSGRAMLLPLQQAFGADPRLL